VTGASAGTGQPPGPVTDAGDDIEVAAERLDVGAYDFDARILAVLDLGHAGLGHTESGRKFRLGDLCRLAHLGELAAADVGLMALFGQGLAVGLSGGRAGVGGAAPGPHIAPL